ncbi:hypothetical protein BsWGS_09630 [Bradybaena similaris]
MFYHQHHILVILFMCVSAVTTLEVTPFMQSARPGEDVEFVCGDSENETKSFYVRWSMEQNISITIPEFGRIQAVNGTLSISNISHDDAGTYMCDDDAGSDTQTGVLEVYDMPDYLREGLIIAGMCLVLFLMLLGGIYMSMIRQRQQKKWQLLQAEKRHKRQQSFTLNINE